MDKDKRKKEQPIPDNLEQLLSSKQQAALQMIQSLGWQLKFVRRPKFLDPEPVVYNAKFDQIGVLDPDGNIDVNVSVNTRTSEPEPEPEQKPQPAAAAFEEDRRQGIAPVPDNLDKLLNQHQLRALRQVETFGWQLHFVRRPLFQDPIAAIISPEGNKIATLEQDGRVNILDNSVIRDKDTKQPPEEMATATHGQGSKKSPPG